MSIRIPRALQFALAVSVLLFAFQASKVQQRLDVASLTYGKVKSVRILNSDGISFPEPITAFFSIPFAAPPIGRRRFAYPQSPEPWKETLHNQNYRDICLQSQVSSFSQSEDCLTLSVFIPEGTTSTSTLPVVLWIPGGAYNVGSGRSLNVPSLVSNGKKTGKFIGVSMNYRLGPLGFLPSNLTNEANLLNLGLSDQLAAMQWIQDEISKFGGDKTKVTLFGESAGAHAIGHFLQHTEGPELFARVIMDSGGPTARTFPSYEDPVFEVQMQEFLEATKCQRNGEVVATFDCLRALDALEIQRVATKIYKQWWSSMQWPFQPSVDYSYIKQLPSKSWEEGKFRRINMLTGFNTNEGSSFCPAGLQNSDEFRKWWESLLPDLTDAHLDKIEELYPSPSIPGSIYANSQVSPEFDRFVDAYGDFAYIAQVKQNAITTAKYAVDGGKTYKYHFAQHTAGALPHLGAYHFSELAFVAVANLTSVLDQQIGKMMNAYYTSFIITGDPNALVESTSTPVWEVYQTGAKRQLKFGGTKGELVEMEDDNIREEAVAYWMSINNVLKH